MTALSIVVPCFNEEACLPELHGRLTAAARTAVGDDYEIVLINDGSSDRSWPVMQRSPRATACPRRSTFRATTGTSWH